MSRTAGYQISDQDCPVHRRRGEKPAQIRRFVQVGHRRAHYMQAGDPDGIPVVLVHGLATLAQEIFTPLASDMGRQGYRIIAFDRPGYGFSDPLPRGRNSPANQATWLGQAIDALGLQLPTLLAHSSGAATVLCLAAQRHRRLSGLIMLSPFSRPTRPAPMPLLRLATLPLIGPLFRRAILPALAPLMGPLMVKAASGEGATTVDRRAFPWRTMARESAILAMEGELRTFNADMVKLRTRLARIRCPAIIVADPADPVLDMLAHVRWLEQRMPDVNVHWVTGAGHLAHHSAPSAVNSALIDLHAAPMTPVSSSQLEPFPAE